MPAPVPGMHQSNPTENYFDNITPPPPPPTAVVANGPSCVTSVAKVDTVPTMINSGALLQTSLEHMDPTAPPYTPPGTLPVSGGPPANVMLYPVPSVSSGGLYRYQPYNTVASGNHPPYTVASGYS